MLLIHEDDDRNVPIDQTVALVRALRAERVDFEQLIFPNEVHNFLLHKHWIEAHEAMDGFFDRKLLLSAAKAPNQP